MKKEKWLRVKRKTPCPICGKNDWCMISPDLTIALCMRQASDWTPRKNSGGWLHRLQEKAVSIDCDWVEMGEQKILPPDELHANLDKLLTCLTLTDDHHAYLQGRNVGEHSTTCNRFRSIKAGEIANSGEPVEFHPLTPGLMWRNDKPWLTIQTDGLLIPIRDEQGRIQALQVRLDNVGGHRYVWMSSAKHGGGSSGAPSHWTSRAYPEILTITEGFFKAEAIHRTSPMRRAVGLSGIQSFNGDLLDRIATEWRKTYHPLEIAYDMDAHSKVEGKQALTRLHEGLEARKVPHRILMWDVQFKGIDDFLDSGRRSFNETYQVTWDDYIKGFLKPKPISAIDIMASKLENI